MDIVLTPHDARFLLIAVPLWLFAVALIGVAKLAMRRRRHPEPVPRVVKAVLKAVVDGSSHEHAALGT